MQNSYEGVSNPNTFYQIPSNWRLIKIKDLCHHVTSGGTPLRSEKNYYLDGEINWFKTQELKNWYLADSHEKITKLGLENSSAKLFPKNTILMAMYGDGKTITSLGILTKPSASNQACCAMIPNQEICLPLFLFYSLNYYKNDFLFIARGGAQRNLNINLIQNFGLLVPPLNVQQKIVDILGSLDDKIELNRQMNQILEAMSRAIFKSWFVDFDPVYAKMEGRDYPLPPDIMDLFPDELEESNSGLIPKGWRVGTVGDIADNQKNVVHPNEVSVLTYYIGLEHMPRRNIALDTWDYSEKVTSNKYSFNKGNILFGKLRPYFHKVGITPIDGICSTDIIVTNGKDSVYQNFLLFLLSSTVFVENVSAASTGTKMPRTDWIYMQSFEIPLPPEIILKKFNSIVKPLVEKIVLSVHSSKNLENLRYVLLPKLMNGELDV